MRVVITEDIIRNALNESIDEFMVNEGMLNELDWGKIAKGAWNGIKNAAAEYMNWRTNGQWNKKYGINPSYNVSQFSELRYLTQWFNIQKKTLNDLLNPQNPSQISRDNTKINQYEGKPNDFIVRECTYQNFTKWAGQYIKNYNGLKFIDEYIYAYITKNYQNPNAAMQAMDIGVFLKTKIGGKTYQEAAGDKNNRKTTTNKDYASTISEKIAKYFTDLYDSLKDNIDNEFFIKYNIANKNSFSNYFKIEYSSGNQTVLQMLNLIYKYITEILYNKKMSSSSKLQSMNSKSFLYSDYGREFTYLRNTLKSQK